MASPIRRVVCALAVLLLLLPGIAGGQPAFEFRLGFADLANQIPDVAGQPIEDEHYGPNGDSLQRTTTGLMAWRKADNWTAFTNGSRSWVNGPFGVMERANEERFEWESDVAPAPRVTPPTESPAKPSAGSPRINVYPTAGRDQPDWSRAPIFWFGRATERENYADVRVAYNDEALYVHAAVVDYHLWYDRAATGDPREFDALGLLLSTKGTGSPAIGPADYQFVSGFRHWPAENDPRWHRQARGAGGEWDPAWSAEPVWTDLIGMRWYNSGPNNDSDLDAGWATTIRVPWATLGLSGPPSPGTDWRMGVRLYDRDENLPGRVEGPKSWPASMVDRDASTWGVLAFGKAARPQPAAQLQGTTVVRRGLSGARVVDGYVGGGGLCQGGVFGDGDKPHPGGENLFVQNQSDIADFPCFSKSYISFELSDVPPGKVILSASLRLHGFGGSDPTQAKPSYIQLFTVDRDWDEATLTWNNAPEARETVGVARVDVIRDFPGWPGVPSDWDATQAVSEAYSAGKPVSLALYSADTAYHSGKYFISSDTGDWNAVARPTLTIQWGERID